MVTVAAGMAAAVVAAVGIVMVLALAARVLVPAAAGTE